MVQLTAEDAASNKGSVAILSIVSDDGDPLDHESLSISMPDKFQGFSNRPVPTQELTESQLKFGYWFVTHRERLHRILIVLLIVTSVILYGYALFAVVLFYGFQYQDYQQKIQTAALDYVNVSGVHLENAIQPIQIVSRDVIPGQKNSADIAIYVKNPNDKWSLDHVSVQITLGGQTLPTQETFILPGEEKYLMALNVPAAGIGTPQVFFTDEQWKRVTQYDTWGPQRLDFLITNKQFLSARQSELSGQLPVSEVQADLTNATAYNYRDLEVQVALFSGTRLVGINKVVLPDVPSGSKKPISLRFTQSLPSITEVRLIPTINLLDQSVYVQF